MINLWIKERRRKKEEGSDRIENTKKVKEGRNRVKKVKKKRKEKKIKANVC